VGRVDALTARRESVEFLEILDAVVKVIINCNRPECHKLNAVQRIEERSVCEDDSADGFWQVALIYPFLKERHDE